MLCWGIWKMCEARSPIAHEYYICFPTKQQHRMTIWAAACASAKQPNAKIILRPTAGRYLHSLSLSHSLSCRVDLFSVSGDAGGSVVRWFWATIHPNPITYLYGASDRWLLHSFECRVCPGGVAPHAWNEITHSIRLHAITQHTHSHSWA